MAARRCRRGSLFTDSAPAVTRVNDCPNPFLKTASTGWFGTGTGRVSTTGLDRAFAFQVNVASSCSAPTISALPSQERTHSFYVKPSASGVQARVSIQSYDGGSFIDSLDGTYVSVPSGVWTRISYSRTLSSNSAVDSCRTVVSSTGSGTLQISKALYEETLTLEDYFDGDSPNAVWNGTDGNSSSTLNP